MQLILQYNIIYHYRTSISKLLINVIIQLVMCLILIAICQMSDGRIVRGYLYGSGHSKIQKPQISKF